MPDQTTLPPAMSIDRNQTRSSGLTTREISEEERLLVDRALKREQMAMKYEENNRKSCKEDVAFADGEQWDQADITKRTHDGRPTLTFNLCPIFIKQVMGNIRMNKPRIKVVPTGGKATKPVAAIYDGIIRRIEVNSNADEVYDEATKQMITGGFAYVRIDNVYACDDMFDRDLRISWIPNQFAVYFDPLPFDLNKQDAEWAMVTSTILRTEFKKAYPDIPETSLPTTGTGDSSSWFKKDEIRIAEYFERECYTENLVLLSNGNVMIEDEAKEYIAKAELSLTSATLQNPQTEILQKAGIIDVPKIVETRAVERHRVWRYKMCGVCLLEEPSLVPGSYIPIIPILGDVNIVDGVRRVKGLVRDIKDAQRRLNYWVSTETEIISNQPRSPWVATPAQIKGFEQDYKDANKKNIAVLRYNFVLEGDTGQPAPPPIRQQPIQPSPGMLEAAAAALNDMKMAAGIFGPSLGEAPAEDVSGTAFTSAQRASDVVSFIYSDNLTRSLKLIGKILLGMIREVYDTERMLRIKDHMNQDWEVAINQDTIDKVTGLQVRLNDLSIGQYGVEIVTGPPYMTARMEAKAELLKFAVAFPEAKQALADLIAKTSDFPLADELDRRLSLVMPPIFRVQKPGDPPPQPTPQQQLMMVELQSKMQVAQFKALYEKAKALKAAADAQKSKDSDIQKAVYETMMQLIQPLLGQPQAGQPEQPGTPQQAQPPGLPGMLA
jgi:Phage P22-like portal protein